MRCTFPVDNHIMPVLVMMLTVCLFTMACDGPVGPPGPAGDTDCIKQVRLPFGTFMPHTEWKWIHSGLETSHLIKFNKNKYKNVESIVFMPAVYTFDSTITCHARLFNLTDWEPIEHSELTTNATRPTFLESQNLYEYLPDKEITLALQIRPSRSGLGVASGAVSYVFINLIE